MPKAPKNETARFVVAKHGVATDTTAAVPRPGLKDRLKNALRKTGHVSEAGLDVVAETAAAIVLGGQFGE